jgi:uncharacterized protein (TIGR00255 family)
MKSMTGFGRGAVAEKEFTINVEIKTVNNRFLDISLRLSQELQPLEQSIKRGITNRLARGRAEVNLSYDRGAEVSYELNRNLIRGYIAAMKEIQNEFKLAGEPDINVIARLPNVLQPKKEDPGEDFSLGVERALEIALDELEKMRETEGSNLRKEIQSRLDSIKQRIPVIESEVPNVAKEYAQRLSKRITEMLANSESQIELDQARLAQEIAYLVDRSDISEELARLKSHIEQFQAVMSESSEVGKRLDFLTQELNREANTILSKSNTMVIKEAALGLKSDIEKIREQIQNVE